MPSAWHVTSEIQSSINLALIQSLTQKVGMSLVVKLQVMQLRTTLVTFFQIRREKSIVIGV